MAFGWATWMMTISGSTQSDLSSWHNCLRLISSPSPLPHIVVMKNQQLRSSQLMATSSVLPVSSLMDARTICDLHFDRSTFPRTSIGNLLLHCFTFPVKCRPFSFIFNAASTDVKYASVVTRRPATGRILASQNWPGDAVLAVSPPSSA
jgi:hypothetical protein